MKLKLFIAPEEKEKYLAIHAPQFDEEVQQIVSQVENLDKLTQIYGKLDNEIYVLEVKTITSFRTHKNQVIALKDGQQFKLKDRLYELEAKLPTSFIRISKSEIVNIEMIEKLLLEPNGLIRMYLKNEDYTYSSRRFLKSIKERLAL
ncbi:DNA-binding response regulator [Staphylococcus devriesei]|uniref:LytTR family transcriptional regulator n=1 Tax=Staphylococcus devriesei TaxID=586733 RepID=A0A2T4KM74_9STAP|nr:LytTR family DNA-binding domain-containing protein [Staphylococcus devriesei]MCE5090124.1 response regulator transcription factor [Staphylococcus devriesei]PTE73433.1 LytTR family transcriptional regulator [Staphylococcus devriesei]PTF03284.1 LytTR family transcriptional regulator [Staphylococcus devriesei]PTF16817.1 LytTR family transcriptional regulator [Staphylococcus devriesei]RIL73503.1 DNA-binding response regulator [Staphylococcus devriesei]